MRPLATIEDPLLRDAIQTLDGRYVIPKRKALTVWSRKIADSLRQKVRGEVKRLMPDYPAYTADLWTAANGDAFLTLTLHAIDESFVVKKFSIGAICFDAPHTGQRILDVINTQMRWVGQDPARMYTITTDQGANMVSAVESLSSKDWLPCINHVMHVALGKVLGGTQSLARASDCASKFRTSHSKWKQFAAIQEEQIRAEQGNQENNSHPEHFAAAVQRSQAPIDPFVPAVEEEAEIDDYGADLSETVKPLVQVLRLKKPVDTRWNSQYACAVRILRLRAALQQYEMISGDSIVLQREDWAELQDIIEIIGPFADFSKQMESSSTPQIQQLLPKLLRILTTVLQQPACFAHAYTGRTLQHFKRLFPDTEELEEMCSMQQKQISIDLQNQMAGQNSYLNQYTSLQAWATSAWFDPQTHRAWNQRITAALSKLIQHGYLKDSSSTAVHIWLQDFKEANVKYIPEGHVAEVESDSEPEVGHGRAALRQGKRGYRAAGQQGTLGLPGGSPRVQQLALGRCLFDLAEVDIIGMMKDLMTLNEPDRTRQNPITPTDRLAQGVSNRALEFSDEEEDRQPNTPIQADSDQYQLDTGQSLNSKVQAELHEFRAAVSSKSGLPLLQFWKALTPKCPYLTRVARRCLSVQPTSSESERIFSIGGHTLSQRRQSMLPETTGNITFITCNQHLLPDMYHDLLGTRIDPIVAAAGTAQPSQLTPQTTHETDDALEDPTTIARAHKRRAKGKERVTEKRLRRSS